MTPVTRSHFTHCGLPGIDLVPYGMHACHFYNDRAQLVGALVPYFLAGLRGNERCLWIAAPPLPAREAIQELSSVWDGVDDAVHSGALRILDFERWYANASGLKGLDVVELWLAEEERALADGYDGLRITGNTSFLAPDDWSSFMEYERAVSERFHGRRIITLCSYSVRNARQLNDVMDTHHCAIERADADWQVVSAPHFPKSAG